MYKRRFYKQDHGEKDGGSTDSSSSSSDSNLEAQTSADSDAETQPQPDPEAVSDVELNDEDGDDDGGGDDDDDGHAPLKPQLPSSSSSGYESEESSANEIEAESAGLLANDDDSDFGGEGQKHSDSLSLRKENGGMVETLAKDHPVMEDIPSCILRCKSIFKCRLCPKIVCLNMESLKTHLQSKRHARSEKLLNDGRLKRILNSDGEEEIMDEEDGETHAERHARIVALAQSNQQQKKSRGRQRQRLRLKRKKQKSSDLPNSGQKTENRSKRRRKNVG